MDNLINKGEQVKKPRRRRKKEITGRDFDCNGNLIPDLSKVKLPPDHPFIKACSEIISRQYNQFIKDCPGISLSPEQYKEIVTADGWFLEKMFGRKQTPEEREAEIEMLENKLSKYLHVTDE